MQNEPAAPLNAETPVPAAKRRLRVLWIIVAAVTVYLCISYVLLPALWGWHDKRHPAIASAETVTRTGIGLPGDPIDVALVGTEEQVQRAMPAAGWYPADPITLESSLRIAVGVVFKRPFDHAPVSPLYLFGRKEALAFEKPVGNNPRERHHVRFWRSKVLDEQGRPLWYGSATFDKRVGLSRDTGQFTHVIAPDVDADRDLLIADLRAAGAIASDYWVDGFHTVLQGKNGEGDPWRTDGRLCVGVLAADLAKQTKP